MNRLEYVIPDAHNTINDCKRKILESSVYASLAVVPNDISPPIQPRVSVWTYIFIIAIVIMVITFFYRLLNTPVVTAETIPDIIFGVPGVSDPYTKVEGFFAGPAPKYYV